MLCLDCTNSDPSNLKTDFLSIINSLEDDLLDEL